MTETNSNADKKLYAKQIGVLRSARLPPVLIDGKNVSAAAMQALLNAIHSRAGVRGTCWAAFKTLAEDTGLSLSQVNRAAKGLRILALMIEHKKRHSRATVYHRRVCFANLKSFVAEQQTLDYPDQFEGSTVDPSKPVERSTVERSTNPLNVQPAHVERSTSTPLNVQRLDVKKTLKKTIKESIKERDGFLKIDSRKQLTDAAFVEQLWQLTLAANPGLYADNDFDRLRFFALAAHVAARWEQFRAPGGLFVTLARGGRAKIAEQINDSHDLPKAKRMIAELDGVGLVGSKDHQAAALDAGWINNDEQRRQAMQRQAAALAALTPNGERFAELTTDQLDQLRKLN